MPDIRADGEGLIDMLARREPPFDGRYTDFVPAPDWPLPTIPDSWDHPHRITSP